MWESTIESSAVTGWPPEPHSKGSSLTLGADSIRGAAAGDIEGGGGREGALFAGQPADQGGDLLYLAQAAHRNFRLHVVDLCLRKLGQDGALEGGGGDAVDAHAGAGQLFAQGFGQADDAGLGGGVGGGVGVAFLAGHGADV